MKSRVIASLVVASSLGLTAAADQTDQFEQIGEVLAWTVDAYGSCEDDEQLQRDFKKEAAALESDFHEIMGALSILQNDVTTCEMKTTFAGDMRRLATTDMDAFEAKLMTFQDPATPVFNVAEPEGSGEAHVEVILEAASTPPPLSSDAPSPESDYKSF